MKALLGNTKWEIPIFAIFGICENEMIHDAYKISNLACAKTESTNPQAVITRLKTIWL